MKLELVALTQGVGKYDGLTSEEIVSAIARHGIIKEDNGKLVRYLMDNKHWSPLDMVNFVFEVETSRAIGRQWLRHKSLNPQEHSQRYSDRVYFEDIELRLEHPTNRQSSTDIINNRYLKAQIDLHLESTERLYKTLIDNGVAKECARMILPECTTTTLSFNGTLRSWLSFLNVRLNNHSQKEIVILANLVLDELKKQMPNVFSQIDTDNGMFM